MLLEDEEDEGFEGLSLPLAGLFASEATMVSILACVASFGLSSLRRQVVAVADGGAMGLSAISAVGRWEGFVSSLKKRPVNGNVPTKVIPLAFSIFITRWTPSRRMLYGSSSAGRRGTMVPLLREMK